MHTAQEISEVVVQIGKLGSDLAQRQFGIPPATLQARKGHGIRRLFMSPGALLTPGTVARLALAVPLAIFSAG